MTQSATPSEIEEALTTGMNDSGKTSPRSGCRQRMRASAPTNLPSFKLTCG